MEMVKTLPYSQAGLYRRISQGTNFFWEIDYTMWGTFIRLRSLEKLCWQFGIRHLRRPIGISSQEWFNGGTKIKRSWLYASAFKIEGVTANPIARDTIQVVTSIGRRQQRRYEEGTLRKVANFAFMDLNRQMGPIRQLVCGKMGRWWKYARLGNIYHARVSLLPRGMTRRINGRLRSGVEQEATPNTRHRFFRSGKSLAKCKNKYEDTFILAYPYQRLIRGRLEWVLVEA